MKAIEQRESNYMDVKRHVQKNFNDELQERLKGTVWNSGCQSWYQQADGRNTTLWPKSTWRYWWETLNVKANDYNFIRLEQDQNDINNSAETQSGYNSSEKLSNKKSTRNKRSGKKSVTEPSAV